MEHDFLHTHYNFHCYIYTTHERHSHGRSMSRLLFGKLEYGSLFAFSMLGHPTGSDVELSVARMKFMRLRFFSPWSLRPRAGFAVNLVAPYAADVRCAVVLCCVFVCVYVTVLLTSELV